MSGRRSMPVGIQTFEDICKYNFVYVDKTDYVHRIAQDKGFYFLARPRRFGKSLFLSTLEAYFLGKRALFQGLKLADLERDWVEYPVLHLDFNAKEYSSVESLESRLADSLEHCEARYGIIANKKDSAGRFEDLIWRLAEKVGRQVVVLIDEYDKPLIETFDRAVLHEAVRNKLRAFFSVLKSVSQHIRFAFLTGVTKFSQVSVFSGLNMLRDISMRKEYGCICGITETELEANFGPEIEALAEREGKSYGAMLAILREKYDGYRFTEDSESVYNPFSLLNVFDAKKIDYYWFETGTTTLLMKEMQRTYFDITRLDKGLYMEASDISDYRVGEDPIPLLYQSGYLTIESYDPESMRYKLCFPNTEVKQGFIKNLLRQYVPVNKRSEFDFNEFYADLAGGDLGEFMVRLEALFASTPYDLVGGWDRERFFQSFLYMLTTLLGCRTYAEYKSIRV